MAVKIYRIEAVDKHPKADRLDIYTVAGNKLISSRVLEGETFVSRYSVGDIVAYIPVNHRVPRNVLKRGFWDEKTDTPILGGDDNQTVVPIKLRGVESSGIMFPVSTDSDRILIEGIDVGSMPKNFELLFDMDVTEELGVADLG